MCRRGFESCWCPSIFSCLDNGDYDDDNDDDDVVFLLVLSHFHYNQEFRFQVSAALMLSSGTLPALFSIQYLSRGHAYMLSIAHH